MKTTTPILASLFRSLSGSSEADPADAVVKIAPIGLLTYAPPFVTEQFSTPNVSNNRTTSGMVSWDETVLLDSNNTLVNLIEGVWQISGYLGDQAAGANDISAFTKIMAQVNPVGGISSTVDIAKLRCNIGSQSVIPFSFNLSVSKKAPVQFLLVIENGGGLCGHRGMGCLSYQRIL